MLYYVMMCNRLIPKVGYRLIRKLELILFQIEKGGILFVVILRDGTIIQLR